MDYQQIYNNLICKAVNESRKKLKKDNNMYAYYEKHHIIPKCVGGTNDKSNLVLLTAREHFVAHQLLVKMHKDNNLLKYALFCMLRSNGLHIRNNKEYEWIRKSRKNIKLTTDQKLHLSKINLGKVLSQEHKDNISAGLLGHTITAETKAKIGLSNSLIINKKIEDGKHTAWNKGLEMSIDAKATLSKSLKDTYTNGRKLANSCFVAGSIPHNVKDKIYHFISPDNIIYKTDNITKFSKNMNLLPQAMACLHKGTYCSSLYKGWAKSEISGSYIEILFNKQSMHIL